MKITLELYDDQAGFDDKDINSSMWTLKVNDTKFPNEKCNLVNLEEVHKIISALMDIEERLMGG